MRGKAVIVTQGLFDVVEYGLDYFSSAELLDEGGFHQFSPSLQLGCEFRSTTAPFSCGTFPLVDVQGVKVEHGLEGASAEAGDAAFGAGDSLLIDSGGAL